MSRTPNLFALGGALALTVATLSAQRTWIVDASGGPGVDFTDIQPAVNAATDGDVILVRAGAYTAVQIAGKGLSVLGAQDVRAADLRITGVAAAQRVVVADLAVQGPGTIFVPTGVRDCPGAVLLERVHFQASLVRPVMMNAADLRLSECEFRLGLWLTGSQVTLTDSHLSYDQFVLGAPPTLGIDHSTVVISRSDIFGQSELNRAAATSAIAMAASTLTLTDNGGRVIAAGSASTTPQPSAIVGNGTLVRDPRVRVVAGSAPPVSGPIDVLRPIASLQVLGATVGSTLEVDLAGAAGEAYALVLGLPGPPLPLPHLGGSVGLSTLAVVAQGVFTTAPIHFSLLVHPGLPPGFTLAWQAVAGDTQGGWQLSNVATYARTR